MSSSASYSPLSVYGSSLALLTDLYQLTMAQAYWANQLTEVESVFHLFFRRMPFYGGFTVAAGLESVIEWVKRFEVTADDIAYLRQLKNPAGKDLFEEGFLHYLKNLRFTGNIDAVPEGTVVFPQQPLIRVQAPLIQAQLFETALLNLINFPTLIATKAARMLLAAQGEEILEFGVRRAQGIDGGLTASRAAYLGGCSATSNVLAGKLLDIPVRGTHAHSWVMAFDDELASFEAYAKAMPDNSLFLVDTYNTLKGVEHAIEVAKRIKANGHEFLGIRLDSGDLAYLSIQSRTLLDEAGFKDAVIVASNELDEILISELKRQGAKINVWGIGTHLVTGGSQPALDGVYKLSALRNKQGEWEDKIKLSEQPIKVTTPGILQVRRYKKGEENVADCIYDMRDPPKDNCTIIDQHDPTKPILAKADWSYADLLIPVYRNGKCVYASPALKEMRETTLKNLEGFAVGIKRFFNPHIYSSGLESSLYYKKLGLIKRIREQISSGV
ncbi:MAG: nicotinate phosphoribosyltransferase [Parachlamydiales bacterium]|jgi:nicotinate phosphoribosyltransferase